MDAVQRIDHDQPLSAEPADVGLDIMGSQTQAEIRETILQAINITEASLPSPNAFALKAQAHATKRHSYMLKSNAWYQKRYKDSTSPPPLPKKPSKFTLLREPSLQLLNRYGAQEESTGCCCCVQ
ncbi:hypothetical protein MBLNU457_7005t2 [Dothideomycetes sp. NU457]